MTAGGEPYVPGKHTIGFIGLGKMGTPMATHLREAGFDLVLQDARPGAAEEFAAEHGGTPAASSAEVAAASDVIITMVPNGRIVREILVSALDGGRGPLARFADGGAVIDMSSSDPQGTVELGAELAEHGVPLVDAPVSGGVPRARTGTLSILMGGDEGVAARSTAVLEPLGSVIHVGPLGAGHAVKALNNLLSAAGLMVAGEVLLVGTRFGIDPHVMNAALNASTGRNNSTENKVEQFILSGTYGSGFALDLMVKDLRTAMRLAAGTNTPSPLSALITEVSAQAQAQLPPDADHTSVVEWFERIAGTRLQDGPAR